MARSESPHGMPSIVPGKYRKLGLRRRSVHVYSGIINAMSCNFTAKDKFALLLAGMLKDSTANVHAWVLPTEADDPMAYGMKSIRHLQCLGAFSAMQSD